MYITYTFIIYNLNTSVHSTLFYLWVFSYIGVILHPYCVIPMYVCTIVHVCIISTKSGLIKTLIVLAVFIVQGSYTFLPTNFHDFSMTFVTISMT